MKQYLCEYNKTQNELHKLRDKIGSVELYHVSTTTNTAMQRYIYMLKTACLSYNVNLKLIDSVDDTCGAIDIIKTLADADGILCNMPFIFKLGLIIDDLIPTEKDVGAVKDSTIGYYYDIHRCVDIEPIIFNILRSMIDVCKTSTIVPKTLIIKRHPYQTSAVLKESALFSSMTSTLTVTTNDGIKDIDVNDYDVIISEIYNGNDKVSLNIKDDGKYRYIIDMGYTNTGESSMCISPKKGLKNTTIYNYERVMERYIQLMLKNLFTSINNKKERNQ